MESEDLSYDPEVEDENENLVDSDEIVANVSDSTDDDDEHFADCYESSSECSEEGSDDSGDNLDESEDGSNVYKNEDDSEWRQISMYKVIINVPYKLLSFDLISFSEITFFMKKILTLKLETVSVLIDIRTPG